MHMKKIMYIFLLVCGFLSIVPIGASAEQYFPKTISIGDAKVYNAGTMVNIATVDTAEATGRMTDIEYGVVQTFTEGYSTSYKIVSTESKSLTEIGSLKDISVVIPNMYENTAKDTYAVYVKYFEKNNPDMKKFFFTDKFGITINESPFTTIKDIYLLQSTGKNFPLLYGPTIYSPEYLSKNTTEVDINVGEKLATSTSLSIVFESNQDLTVNPVISFSKLRSDSKTEIIKSQPLQIKKGQTQINIPLPTFDYVPGVYMGKITFTENSVKNDFNFQYIIGGDSVTIGMVEVVKDDTLKFNIFNTPLDRDRSYAIDEATTSAIYNVSGIYLDAKGNASGNFTNANVDFAKESFEVIVPKKTFFNTKIATIQLKVTAKDGTVVYEGTKKIDYEQKSKVNLFDLIVYILLAIILIAALVKKSFKLAILFVLLALLASLGMYYKINAFSNEYLKEPYRASFKAGPGDDAGKGVILTTEDNLITKKFTCGEDINVNYEFKLSTCSNLPATGSYNIGFVGQSKTSSSTKVAKVGSKDLGAYTLTYPASLEIPNIVANTELTIHSHRPRKKSTDPWKPWDKPGDASTYNIPLLNTCGDITPTCECSGRTQVCTKAGLEVSRTENSASCSLQASCEATISGPNVAFKMNVTHAIGKVTFKDSATGNAVQETEVKQISAGQSIVQTIVATDSKGSTATAVCTAQGEKTSSEDTCLCTGRDLTCTSGVTGKKTVKSKATQCALGASCGYTITGPNVTFSTYISNALGTVVYKDGVSGNTISSNQTKRILPGQKMVQTTIATDSDGSTASATCFLETDPNGKNKNPPCTPGTPGCTDGGSRCTPGTTGCPPDRGQTGFDDPEILTFIVPIKPVTRRESCGYLWSVRNVSRCTLSVNGTGISLLGNGLNGSSATYVPATDGNNQRAILTCVAEDLLPLAKATVSTTTICQVLPEVIER